MDSTPVIQALLRAGIPDTRLHANVPMSKITTFRVGGPCDLLVDAGSIDDIMAVIDYSRHLAIPLTIIGNASNLLVRDGGIRGIVLRVSSGFSSLYKDGNVLHAQAGISLHSLAVYACAHGLSGLAECSGIPGTLGGGAVMNAGAYGAELSDVISRVEGISLDTNRPVIFEKPDLQFSYRHSAMMDQHILISDVTLNLSPGNPSEIAARMQELARLRKEKQPLEYPSAGSTFKRPEGAYASKLIDDCGLRGYRFGDAMVSPKHAGFIINCGHATASSILLLMEHVSTVVKEQTGYTLVPEVRILGEDSPSDQKEI